MALLRRGLVGEPVRILQENLGVTADGIFGKATEAALIDYQKANGLSPDGIAGPDTFHAMGLYELILLHRPIRGNLVRRLQEGLGIGADGVFGPGTEKAVKQFQESNGIEATGQAGPETLRHIAGFEFFTPEKIEAALVTENTPNIDESGIEQVKVSEEAPPQQESLASYAANQAVDAATLIGRSIWSTVRSIF